jgi:small subunit ribosomal protein S2
MRAIQLYASAIADAVLEGKSSVPQVVVGEDEFVELDEEGNPRRKSARPGRPKPAATVRRKTPPRRRPAVIAPAAAPVVADEGALEAELDDAAEIAEPAAAPAPIGVKRRTGAGPARRPRSGNGAS